MPAATCLLAYWHTLFFFRSLGTCFPIERNGPDFLRGIRRKHAEQDADAGVLEPSIAEPTWLRTVLQIFAADS